MSVGTGYKAKAYILTVDPEGGSRRSHAADEAAQLDLPWQFVEGVSLNDDDPTPSEYSRLFNLFLYPRTMTAGEIAVYLGHRRAWQQVLDEGEDYGLILEDDFRIADRDALQRAVDDAVSHPGGWNIIKFFDVWSKTVMTSMTLGSTKFVCRKYPPNGAVGYLIDAAAARALLSRKRIFRPVDEDISRPWEFGLWVWSSERNLVTEVSHTLGGSLLEERRKEEAIQQRRNPVRNIMIRNTMELYKFVSSKRYVAAIKNNLRKADG